MTKDEFTAWAETTEGREILAPLIDRRVNMAVRSHDEKLKPELEALKKAAQPVDVAKRLEAIEAAASARARKAELRYHLRATAAEAGVDPSLLDGIDFSSEEEITERIGRLAEHDEELRRAATNAQLSSSFKPGTGNGPPPPDPYKGMLSDEEAAVALRMKRMH